MPGLTYPFEAKTLDQEMTDRDAVMVAMQMEALGVRRREKITTTDFKENKAAFVSSEEIQSSRLVNQRGTAESKLARGAFKQLNAWNEAFSFLQDDGTAEPGLRNVNEGLGQTHRGKLQADGSVRCYTGEPGYYRGGNAGRGGRGGGRAGGFAGQGSGRHAFKERSPAVTRTRVVKGHSVNLDSPPHSNVKVKMSPVPQPTIKTMENPDLQAAREFMNSAGGSSNRGNRLTKDFNAPTQGSSKRVRVPKPAEDTMTTPARDTRTTISYEAKLVSPASFMASVRDHSTSQSASSSSAQQQAGHKSVPFMDQVAPQAASSKTKFSAVAPPKEKPISVGKPSSPVADVAKPKNVTQTTGPDLMDLDLVKEATIQPVLNFTRPQEETAPQATAAPESDTLITDIAMHIRALEVTGLLSKEQLDMLRALENARDAKRASVTAEPKTEVEPAKSTRTTAHNKASHSGKYNAAELFSLRPTASATSTPKGMQQVNPFAVGVIELLPSNSREARGSLALQLAEQRETLIGEHVHRSRFQTHGSLVEGFKKLTISDDVPADATVSHSESISSDVAPEEPPKVPEVFEYAKDNPFGPAKKKAGLSLPPHLRDQKPAADPGAAVRAQYGLADVPASVSNDLQPSLPTAKAATPSLPPPLRSESPSDAGATARAQHGGGVVPARTSKVQLQAHVLTELTKPSLLGHLRGQTANDTAAAMATTGCANNGDVLAPIYNNGQLRSSTFTGVTTSTTAASQATARAPRFNQSGFLGLAAHAREAQRPTRDLLKIAASKSF